jgi:hypothetical protein
MENLKQKILIKLAFFGVFVGSVKRDTLLRMVGKDHLEKIKPEIDWLLEKKIDAKPAAYFITKYKEHISDSKKLKDLENSKESVEHFSNLMNTSNFTKLNKYTWDAKKEIGNILNDLKKLEEEWENNLAVKLQDLFKQDQKVRREYEEYLRSFSTWEEARDAWMKDKNLDDADNIFNDSERLSKAKDLISPNMAQILKDGSSTWRFAWLLVQHMDDDPTFQQHFLDALGQAKIKGSGDEYRLLHDRLSVNKGKPQKYNTQNPAKTLEEIKARK